MEEGERGGERENDYVALPTSINTGRRKRRIRREVIRPKVVQGAPRTKTRMRTHE